jgi:hypothetical protein
MFSIFASTPQLEPVQPAAGFRPREMPTHTRDTFLVLPVSRIPLSSGRPD